MNLQQIPVATLLGYLTPILQAALTQIDPNSKAGRLLGLAVQILGLFSPSAPSAIVAPHATLATNLTHPDVLKIAGMLPQDMTHENILAMADSLPPASKVA